MDEQTLGLYLDEVSRAPKLHAASALALWRVAECGGAEAQLARDRLVEAHLRLAVSVAKKYIGRGLPLAELIGASNRGLLRAVERFDHRKGVPFSAYAVWWMRHSLVSDLERARDQEPG